MNSPAALAPKPTGKITPRLAATSATNGSAVASRCARSARFRTASAVATSTSSPSSLPFNEPSQATA